MGGLQRVKNLPFGVIERPGPPWPLARVPEHLTPHEQHAVETLGWTTSAQTGQVAVPIWKLISSRETLTVRSWPHFLWWWRRGECFQTLEDTGLRFVVKGALVWMAGADSPKVTVRPTNREIGPVFAGQTDGLQGEALGKTWAPPWWYPCSRPQPSWQSRVYMASRAGLFKVGSTPEVYLVFVLVLVACFHMTFGLMEDQCTRSLPYHSVTLWPASAPPQAGLGCPPLGLGFARGSRS